MPPARIIKSVVGSLMEAYHDCRPFDAKTASAASVMFYSGKHNQFGLDGPWKERFNALAAKCDEWLDQYPLGDFERFLQGMVADAREATAPDAATSQEIRQKLEDFFKRIKESTEWVVLIAVFGFAADQPAFHLADSHFHLMDQTE